MKAKCYKTVVPLKRPFATSRFTTSESTNYIIEIEDEGIIGIGEAAARGVNLTGDQKVKLPKVVEEMLFVVNRSHIDFGTKLSAIDSIKKIYSELELIASSNAVKINKNKPFRGVLSGFDIALLDLAAKKMNIKVSELLGQKREKVYVSASTISVSSDYEKILSRLKKHALIYDAFRCKGAADKGENIRRLSLMREANKELGLNNTYWIDLNEALSLEEAVELVNLTASWLKKRESKDEVVILEQPIKKSHYKELCELQALSQSILSPESGKIVIMADESLWDVEDFKVLSGFGGCGAINIKIPKVGGLIKAVELGEYVEKINPDTMIYVGGMIGTSDIMGRSIYNLCKSLPRIDLCTTSPAMNVSVNLASDRLLYKKRGENEITLGDKYGLGTDLNYEALQKSLDDSFLMVKEASLSEKKHDKLIDYNRPELLVFSPVELDSHLIEVEALLLGLVTERVSSRRFAIVDPDEEKRVSFSWTMASGLPKETRMACKEKAVAKKMFLTAGAPVSEGRLFQLDEEYKPLVSYAESIGWPVVVKPNVGTGGVGVTANITNADDLVWAIDKISSDKLTSDRNDGSFILEKHVAGKELRILVAGGKAINAIERIQAHVVGDGYRSISELVDIKNRLRSKNPFLSRTKLKKGSSASFQLKRQGKTLESIPFIGEVVTLSPVFSTSQGGDMRCVIDEVHPTVLAAAVKAVRGVPHLHESGVDIILQDYSCPIDNQQACICEVNSSPVISSSHFPMYGKSINAAREFLVSVLSRKFDGRSVDLSKNIISSEFKGKLVVGLDCDLSSVDKRELIDMFGGFGVECTVFKSRFKNKIVCMGALDKVLVSPSLTSVFLNKKGVENYSIISSLV